MAVKHQKKNKKARPTSRPRFKDQDSIESFEAHGISMTRVGKNIYTRNNRTPEEHQEFLRFVREEMLPGLRENRQQLRARLGEILAAADPVDLLARASFLYLPINPNTYKEWESDRHIAHIEYLALQVLPSSTEPEKEVDPKEETFLTSEAIHVVRDLFEVEANFLLASQVEDPQRDRDQAYRYRISTQLESMGVRGTAYGEHSRAILLGTLGQFDVDCSRLLGFTAQQALDITVAIVSTVEDRLEPIMHEAEAARQLMLKNLSRQRRKGLPGPVPDWIVELKPTEAKWWIGAITRMWSFADARSLATVKPEDVATTCGIPVVNVESFLEAFSCPPSAYVEAYHRLPVGAHPLTERPLMSVQGGYILPVPSSMIEALRPRMEDLLQKADQTLWERYAKRRADYVEQESVNRICAAIPGALGANGLKWRSTSDESDLDGLVS